MAGKPDLHCVRGRADTQMNGLAYDNDREGTGKTKRQNMIPACYRYCLMKPNPVHLQGPRQRFRSLPFNGGHCEEMGRFCE